MRGVPTGRILPGRPAYSSKSTCSASVKRTSSRLPARRPAYWQYTSVMVETVWRETSAQKTFARWAWTSPGGQALRGQ